MPPPRHIASMYCRLGKKQAELLGLRRANGLKFSNIWRATLRSATERTSISEVVAISRRACKERKGCHAAFISSWSIVYLSAWWSERPRTSTSRTGRAAVKTWTNKHARELQLLSPNYMHFANPIMHGFIIDVNFVEPSFRSCILSFFLHLLGEHWWNNGRCT